MKWALDRGLFIIADEIYDQLVYEPNKPSSIIVWWKQYPDRIAVVNGLAKSFAMTGWRVGYTVTHPDLVKKLSQITGQATGNICSVSQKAAVAALTGPYDCVESMRQAFQKRRDMAWKEIASWSNVVCPKPEGAFYLFADISALYDEKMPDATAACTRLLSEAGVALVPGDAFGAPDGMHTLDWKHAWTGRLLTTAPTRPQALKLLEPQLDSCNARLIGEVASGKLPFLNLPFRSSLTARLKALTPQLRRFKHMVVLGIGGSALGTRALQKAFFPQQDLPNHQGPWLWILDNVDADVLEAQMSTLNPEETIVVPVSKSGGTIETLAQYFFMKAWLQRALPNTWHEHMLLVTDEKKGYLREEADRHNIVSLPVPDHLGGRYSVLSAVGLVPAAFMGLPWEDFLEGAASVNAPLVNDELGKPENLRNHPAWALANWCFELSRHDYSQLIFFTYIPSWASFGQWFGQLWAESLGKNGKGTMPLPAVGVTDQHSLQQMFLDGPADKGCIQLHCPNLSKGPQFPDDVPDSWEWLRGKTFGDLLNAETLGSAAALVHNGVPLTRLEAAESSMRAAGEVMGLLMATTVLTGWLMNINPLDQPAVELGKRLAYSRLGSSSYPEEAAILKAFLD